MAQAIEMDNLEPPEVSEVPCGREVDFLPQKSGERIHLRISVSGTKKRHKEGGREGRPFPGPRDEGHLHATEKGPGAAGFVLPFVHVPWETCFGEDQKL